MTAQALRPGFPLLRGRAWDLQWLEVVKGSVEKLFVPSLGEGFRFFGNLKAFFPGPASGKCLKLRGSTEIPRPGDAQICPWLTTLNSLCPRSQDLSIQRREGLAITLKLRGACRPAPITSQHERSRRTFSFWVSLSAPTTMRRQTFISVCLGLSQRPVAGCSFQRMLRRYSRELEQG